MLAVVCTEPGPPEVLVLEERPDPEPRPGWAVVRVHARGVNRSEVFTRQGHSGASVAFPRVLGIEAVGEVAAVASGSALEPGQVVAAAMGGMGRAYDGGYQQLALLPEDQLMPLRTTLDWPTLAALPETWLTAGGSLRLLGLGPGARLLITGATSSVGLAAIRLAVADGVEVIAVTRSTGKAAALADAGAAHVVVAADAAELGATLTNAGREIDGAVDLSGRDWLRTCLRAVRRGATVCATGILDGWILDDFQPLAEIPTATRLTAFSSETLTGAEAAHDLQAIVDSVQAGRVAPDIEVVLGLEQAADAHRRLESGATTGKIVLAG